MSAADGVLEVGGEKIWTGRPVDVGLVCCVDGVSAAGSEALVSCSVAGVSMRGSLAGVSPSLGVGS